MNILIATFRRRGRSPQVTRENLARERAHNKQRAEVARQRREYVALLFVERVSRTDGGGFLPEATIEPALNLALLVKVVEPVLERPSQPHEKEQVELLAFIEFHFRNQPQRHKATKKEIKKLLFSLVPLRFN